ncbi:hypothetical protein [Aliarcobacter skirrowii]|uniref:Cold shock domain-containing protein n=1 Tax=Aliarcobacter skirrowii CCUG 10374 TaxID=1032239 RepID=A0AAD0SKT4_9BACT|nr:hypothetical protein [Aliarcobacter skirrowii]AXX84529.1 hypothetical protein ASKIR_0704 [Aliarcobacter skirrowii CCUG 10374]KAB0621299.1 hypothetical protein F7P70_00195 [Aliarcobacter skirrowii CCUG 10374]RXI26555.1 hypothetical protein CP959_00195 [Aliarcobacter skirrowii CCUG 10374]SUV14688.1 Uncharacterised protein [Aliarcobacter skirrowii]HAC70288.1 hypothetical protein [Aliarcobacter skirrowii]
MFGKIIAFNKKDKNGFIIDENGKSHYFDEKYLTKDTDVSVIKEGVEVQFDLNEIGSNYFQISNLELKKEIIQKKEDDLEYWNNLMKKNTTKEEDFEEWFSNDIANDPNGLQYYIGR